jgi:hypothetical protein
MLRTLVRGAFAGAALLGVIVLSLGGASLRLVVFFWGLGLIATWLKDVAAAKLAARRHSRQTSQGAAEEASLAVGA